MVFDLTTIDAVPENSPHHHLIDIHRSIGGQYFCSASLDQNSCYRSFKDKVLDLTFEGQNPHI